MSLKESSLNYRDFSEWWTLSYTETNVETVSLKAHIVWYLASYMAGVSKSTLNTEDKEPHKFGIGQWNYHSNTGASFSLSIVCKWSEKPKNS